MRVLSIVAVASALAIAGCANVTPVGRNAQRAEQQQPAPVAAPRTAPTPAPATTLPPPQRATPAPAPQQQAAALPPPPAVTQPAPQAAPVTAPPAAAAPTPAPVAAASAPTAAQRRQGLNTNNDEVIVPGQVQRQVRPPQGDPRTNSERREDIRAWDRCVIEVQGGAFDNDATEPQLDTPEDVCRTQLGMADRDAVPITRRRDR